MPQHKINPNRHVEPTLPGLDAFDAPAGYQEIALKFGASIIPPHELNGVTTSVVARQEQLCAAFVREAAKPSPLDTGAMLLASRALASCQVCPFVMNGECVALDGLEIIDQQRAVGGKKHTIALAKTGVHGNELTESLMQKGVTLSALASVPPACPLATLMEAYKPRPASVPISVEHLARIAGIALAQQHFRFYGEPLQVTLKAGKTVMVRDTVYACSDIPSASEGAGNQDTLPVAV